MSSRHYLDLPTYEATHMRVLVDISKEEKKERRKRFEQQRDKLALLLSPITSPPKVDLGEEKVNNGDDPGGEKNRNGNDNFVAQKQRISLQPLPSDIQPISILKNNKQTPGNGPCRLIKMKSSPKLLIHDPTSVASMTELPSRSTSPFRMMRKTKSISNLLKYEDLKTKNERQKVEIKKMNEELEIQKSLKVQELNRDVKLGPLMVPPHLAKLRKSKSLGENIHSVPCLSQPPFKVCYKRKTEKQVSRIKLKSFLDAEV